MGTTAKTWFSLAFGLATAVGGVCAGATDSVAYLASEARIVKWQIIRHQSVFFDYPYHWDHQIPIFLKHGDRLRFMLDLVHYDPQAPEEVVTEGLDRTDFKLSWRVQNKAGQTKFFAPPSGNVRWIPCPWAPEGFEEGQNLSKSSRKGHGKSSGSGLGPSTARRSSPENGRKDYYALRPTSSACGEIDFIGDYLHAGILSFTTGKYRSTLAIENAHDWALALAQDLRPQEKAQARADLLEESELIKYQHFVAAEEDEKIGEGEWIFIYGLRFWRPPQMNPPWRPYAVGRWAYSPYGLVWEAGTHFGRWAEHYGVWRWHEKYGLLVQLHYVWQPAVATFYGRPKTKAHDAWLAWRPVVPYLFKIKNRTYFPYRLGEKFGFKDYPTLANRGWPPNEVIDYVMVAPENITHEPAVDVDQSDLWINAPAGRDAILRPQDQLQHFSRAAWNLLEALPMQAIQDDLAREEEEDEEEDDDENEDAAEDDGLMGEQPVERSRAP